MLTPEDLFTIAHADLAERRAGAEAAAARAGRTIRAGRPPLIRALGRTLVAAGTRLEGRPSAKAPVPSVPPDPCGDDVVLPRAA